MKSSLKTLLILILVTTPMFARRPKKEKPPKEPKTALTQEQKQVIVANAAQVVGGICNIAIDPHNPHNVGGSVGGMIQAFINIIIAKLAQRNIDFNGELVIEDYVSEIRKNITREITEIIITQKTLVE